MASLLAAFQMVDVAILLVTGLVYGYVGARLSRRGVGGEARLAWVLFTHWWYGIAALTLLGALAELLRTTRVSDHALHVTLLYVNLLLLCYALWALLYYLAYLFTGSRRVLVPISLFYVGSFAFFTYAIAAAGPFFDEAAARIAYERPPSPSLLRWMLVLVATPQILGALGYFTLFFRADDRTQRYRIGLVSWSIIVWFGTIPVGQLPFGVGRVADAAWWPVVTHVVGLLAAVTILLAYRPPGWIRARYRVRAVDDSPPAE